MRGRWLGFRQRVQPLSVRTEEHRLPACFGAFANDVQCRQEPAPDHQSGGKPQCRRPKGGIRAHQQAGTEKVIATAHHEQLNSPLGLERHHSHSVAFIYEDGD